METQQQGKAKLLKKEGDRPPDEMHVLRCPNPGCGKTHFSVGNSIIEGTHFGSSCSSCGPSDHMGHYLVYETGGKMMLKAFCGICRKEQSLSFPGIRRICERCGWVGEFFLGLQKIAV